MNRLTKIAALSIILSCSLLISTGYADPNNPTPEELKLLSEFKKRNPDTTSDELKWIFRIKPEELKLISEFKKRIPDATSNELRVILRSRAQAAEINPTLPSLTLEQYEILILRSRKRQEGMVEEIKLRRIESGCAGYDRYSTNDGPTAMQNTESEIASNLFNKNNYLETDIFVWNGSGGTKERCLFDDGRPLISALNSGYRQKLNAPGNPDSWVTNLDAIKELRVKYPRAISIALLEVEYWESYAWHARGGGYSSTVTKDGHKLFAKRMARAEKLLLESKPYASDLPLWYSNMIATQSALGYSRAEVAKTFLEGVSKDKLYYPLYSTMLNYNLPKWGGTWEAVDELVNWSVENTQDTEGNAMYARMYDTVYKDLREGNKLFEDTNATWPKMKKGFQDMMQRYPKSNWNLNNFAKFSCLADDKKTFLSLRKKIGSKVYNEAWYGNATLDLCDNKMGYVK